MATATKKKTKIVKRAKTGVRAAPVEDFFKCKEYFHFSLDKKDYGEIIKEYIKKNYSPDEYKTALKAPDYYFTGYSHVAASVYWKNHSGKEFPERWDGNRCISDWVNKIIIAGNSTTSSVDDETTAKTVEVISPMQRLQQKVNETILTEFDTVIDAWIQHEKPSFDLYSLMKKYELTAASATFIEPKLLSLKSEITDCLEKTCEQAMEAYSEYTKPELTAAIKLLDGALADLQSLKMESKAKRAPRAKKPRAADKQVAKVNYQKEDRNFKLVSIPPIKIVGAMRLYVFNTANRKITEYVTTSTKGFEISGTTIKNFDPELSRTTTLRKPEEFLPMVLKKTYRQIDKEWGSLTTKNSVPNGRLNETTILLRALDQ